MNKLQEGLSPEVSEKAKEIFKSMINDKRDDLFKKYGMDAEKVAYGHAIKQAKKILEKTPELTDGVIREITNKIISKYKK